MTSFNDLVFKLFAVKKSSRGGFIAIVGFFWMLSLLLLPMKWGDVQTTLKWGIISGFFSVTANILLIESMARQSTGLCSTIFRLNMVFVVIMAFFMLDEKISTYQWIAISLAVCAVLFFMPFSSLVGANGVGFAMALVASILRAMMGISYKYAFEAGVDKNALVMVNSFMWIVPGILYAAFREHQWGWIKDMHVLKYGVISGLLVAGVVIGMAGSLSLGDASRVLPLAQMSFLVTFVLSMIFLKEKCDTKKVLALVFGAAAILLLVYDAK